MFLDSIFNKLDYKTRCIGEAKEAVEAAIQATVSKRPTHKVDSGIVSKYYYPDITAGKILRFLKNYSKYIQCRIACYIHLCIKFLDESRILSDKQEQLLSYFMGLKFPLSKAEKEKLMDGAIEVFQIVRRTIMNYPESSNRKYLLEIQNFNSCLAYFRGRSRKWAPRRFWGLGSV